MNSSEECMKHKKKHPSKGDWCELVKQDMEKINITIDEESMCGMGKTQFKSIVRKSVMSVVFNSLKTVQLTHTKVRNILYPNFELQPYLQSDLIDS